MKKKQTIRILTLPFLVGCALLLTPIGSQADTLPRVKASAGDYEATPKKLTGGLYQLGMFLGGQRGRKAPDRRHRGVVGDHLPVHR